MNAKEQAEREGTIAIKAHRSGLRLGLLIGFGFCVVIVGLMTMPKWY